MIAVLKAPLAFKDSFMQQNAALSQAGVVINIPVLAITLVLISIGIIIVASASIDFAAVNYGDPWFFCEAPPYLSRLSLFL